MAPPPKDTHWGHNRLAVSHPRALVGLGGLVAAIALVLVTVNSVSAQRHPGGDPSGTVLNTMKGIERAVPAGATQTKVRTYPTQWVTGCPETRNPQAGWDKEAVYVTFTDPDPAALVDGQIASTLEKSGWSPSPMRITKGQGLVPHWQRTVSKAQPIDAFAYAVPNG